MVAFWCLMLHSKKVTEFQHLVPFGNILGLFAIYQDISWYWQHLPCSVEPNLFIFFSTEPLKYLKTYLDHNQHRKYLWTFKPSVSPWENWSLIGWEDWWFTFQLLFSPGSTELMVLYAATLLAPMGILDQRLLFSLLSLGLEIYHAPKTCQWFSGIMRFDVATWSYMKPHCLWITFFSIFFLLWLFPVFFQHQKNAFKGL